MAGKKKRVRSLAKAKPRKLQILDEKGRPAPRVTAENLRRRTGHAFKLAERRGAVIIARDGEDVAVMLSLAQFWRLLFEFALRSPLSLKKPSPRKRAAK